MTALLSCNNSITESATGSVIGADPNATGAVELCGDGLDNDGNNKVDEGCSCLIGTSQDCYPGPIGTRGVGICKDGTQQCKNSGEFSYWGDCSGFVIPTNVGDCGWNGSKTATGPEVCGDGIDNDGNGLVDCKDPACATLDTCRGVIDNHPTDGTCVVSGNEVCDGKDNDCNGLVDESGICDGLSEACLPYSCMNCDQYCGEFRVCRSDGTWSSCRFTGPVRGTDCYPRCYKDVDCQKGFACSGGLCEPSF